MKALKKKVGGGVTLTITPETAKVIVELCDKILKAEAELKRRRKGTHKIQTL